jgi:hypothetical protein
VSCFRLLDAVALQRKARWFNRRPLYMQFMAHKVIAGQACITRVFRFPFSLPFSILNHSSTTDVLCRPTEYPQLQSTTHTVWISGQSDPTKAAGLWRINIIQTWETVSHTAIVITSYYTATSYHHDASTTPDNTRILPLNKEDRHWHKCLLATGVKKYRLKFKTTYVNWFIFWTFLLISNE